MLLVLSHTPAAMCSAQQGLIFAYWQEPADLGLPLHTCLTHGRPKIHTYHVCTDTLFIILAPNGRCAQCLLFWVYDWSGIELVRASLMGLESCALSREQWLHSWGFRAGFRGSLLQPSTLAGAELNTLSTEVGLLVETAQNVRKSKAESLRKAFKS